MAETQQELLGDLTALTAQVTKIGTETQTILQRVSELEAALLESGRLSPDVEAALTALKAQVKVVDDLVPDVEPPPDGTV